MNFLKRLRASFRRSADLFRKPKRDAEFAAELESHLQLWRQHGNVYGGAVGPSKTASI